MMRLCTVLVIDDDRVLLQVIRDALEDDGYAVLTAMGRSALPIARAFRPDLILLDIVMPGMDGIEISRQLRADPMLRLIPIIAMSSPEQLADHAARMRANDRLPKPFTLETLSIAISRWASLG